MCATPPLIELRILRTALRLLIATEQIDANDELLIATQTRNVLHYGTRHAPGEAQPCDIVEETLPEYDSDAFPPLMLPIDDDESPPFPGFTIEDRVRQLGYPIFLDHYRPIFLPALVLHIAAEWVSRFNGRPAQHKGQDWYCNADIPWLDPAIIGFMRRISSARKSEDTP